MKYAKLIPILIALAVITSCGNDDDSSSPSGASLNLDQTAILNLINQHRAAGATCGSTAKATVPALSWSDELAKAALDHSNDMQANNYFSHTGQNGSSFSERAIAAGYQGFPVGENIAGGQTNEADVIAAWMASEGHCNNIMNPNATTVGVAKSKEGNPWTMVLGSN